MYTKFCLLLNSTDVHRQSKIVSTLAKIVISIFRLGEKAMEDMVGVIPDEKNIVVHQHLL